LPFSEPSITPRGKNKRFHGPGMLAEAI
jgi:hypothetical protein